MSNLEPEDILLTIPDGSTVGSRLSEINVDKITVTDLTVTGAFIGPAGIVYVDAVQTLTNKSFTDDSCAFINGADPTVAMFMDVAGASGTAASLRTEQVDNRIYTIPDSGADCNFVMTAGAQTVGGTKTFTDTLIAQNIQSDQITELTLNAGVTIDSLLVKTFPLVDTVRAMPAIAQANLALVPRGTGGLLAAVPDNAVLGGTARGQYAVDFQLARTAASEVASGDYSVVAGGVSNTAGAPYAAVSGGQSNLATGIYACVGGGTLNTASGELTAISGGLQNTASGLRSVVGGGQLNVASNPYSAVLGGTGNTASGTYSSVAGGISNTASGDYSHASGRQSSAQHQGAYVISDSTAAAFASTANNQYCARFNGGYNYIGGPVTVNNFITNYYMDAPVVTVDAQTVTIFTIPIVDNTTYLYKMYLIAEATDGSASNANEILLRIKMVAGIFYADYSISFIDGYADPAFTSLVDGNQIIPRPVLSGSNVLLQITGNVTYTFRWYVTLKVITMTI